MKIKYLFLLVSLFLASTVMSQSNLNNYKYVIVPKKFDFLKQENQYQLNLLTKFLFDKYGFETLMLGEDYPEDLTFNRCLALKSDVIKDSGLFKTKLNVVLRDCNDRVVYTSQTGESREKEYVKAYNEAIRDAFNSFETINYKFNPDNATASPAVPQPPKPVKSEVVKEIQELKAEIESLKKEKESKPKEVKQEVAKVKEVVQEVVQEKPQIKEVKSKQETIKQVGENVLYAQPIEENGFQLVDSSPKVVYRIKTTNLNNVYLVEGKEAIVYKKGDNWFVEHYQGDTLKKEALNIKF